jgi:hypothetical protein
MKLYAPKAWEKITSSFPIFIEHEDNIFINDETAKVLSKLFPKTNGSCDLEIRFISITNRELKRRFDILNITSGERTDRFTLKNNIVREKLYEIINWEKCQKNKLRFIKIRNFLKAYLWNF